MTVAEHPLLFRGPMVRAILEGRKTQTRRVITELLRKIGVGYSCPYGVPGDRLWVRETWKEHCDENIGTCVKYKADGAVMKPTLWTHEQAAICEMREGCEAWSPSIHMPRWASRITLEVAGVRVERLQEISAADARAEGVSDRLIQLSGDRVTSKYLPKKEYDLPNGVAPTNDEVAIANFAALWDSGTGKGGNGKHAWASNPWVWVIEFRRIN